MRKEYCYVREGMSNGKESWIDWNRDLFFNLDITTRETGFWG